MSHETKKVQIELPESAAALGDSLVKIVESVKAALKDGFQPGQDLPPLMASGLEQLIAAVKVMGGVITEADEDKLGVAQALTNSGFAIAKVIAKKDEATQA